MASFLERTLSNSNATMEKLIKDAAKQNCTAPGFTAKDSMMPPAFAHIDMHRQGTSMDALINQVIRETK